ncbi:hypothetical protein GGX14DRAFT_621072 [Mycena pura]|uniref:Uncharacterized protein n=1 Tax=Mycena pura TaxID=153505 RepID=A0AAD6YD54_9AGAR|nr:hypothetical protein GGX14DRAFT_621072 [Mycena pura]
MAAHCLCLRRRRHAALRPPVALSPPTARPRHRRSISSAHSAPRAHLLPARRRRLYANSSSLWPASPLLPVAVSAAQLDPLQPGHIMASLQCTLTWHTVAAAPPASRFELTDIREFLLPPAFADAVTAALAPPIAAALRRCNTFYSPCPCPARRQALSQVAGEDKTGNVRARGACHQQSGPPATNQSPTPAPHSCTLTVSNAQWQGLTCFSARRGHILLAIILHATCACRPHASHPLSAARRRARLPHAPVSSNTRSPPHPPPPPPPLVLTTFHRPLHARRAVLIMSTWHSLLARHSPLTGRCSPGLVAACWSLVAYRRLRPPDCLPFAACRPQRPPPLHHTRRPLLVPHMAPTTYVNTSLHAAYDAYFTPLTTPTPRIAHLCMTHTMHRPPALHMTSSARRINGLQHPW